MTTTDGGALLTLTEPTTFWTAGTSTFAGLGLTTETGSFQEIALDGSNSVLTFTLQAGYVFSEFKMADGDAGATAFNSTLSSGTWSFQENLSASTITNGGSSIFHQGANNSSFIAEANVAGLNSFSITFGDQTEDSHIGFAYSASQVPEPSSALFCGIVAVAGLMRRRRS